MTDVASREDLVRLRSMLTDMARPEAVEPRINAAVEQWAKGFPAQPVDALVEGARRAFRALWFLDLETDRGCALVGASVLDDALSRLLRASFVQDTKLADRVLSESGAAGTFSQRIDLCAALTLLPPLAVRELTLIRRIRNAFAHDGDVAQSFDQPAIASRCRELQIGIADFPQETARDVFTASVYGCLVAIDIVTYYAEPLRPTSPETVELIESAPFRRPTAEQ